MGFYIQDDFWEALEDMPTEIQNEVIGALTRTFYTGEVDTELSGASKAIYIALRERVLIARKKAAAGRSKKNQTENQTVEQTENQNAEQNEIKTAIKTEGVLLKSESESKSKNKRKNTLVVANAPTKVEGGRFAPPTPAQVEAYAKARGQTIDAERFCDFYASKGWRVGKSPMKDWQACVRTWLARDNPKGGDRDEEFERYAALI